MLSPIEGTGWVCTLIGREHDYPPDDEAGFLAFAKSLPDPSLYETVRGAEPLSDIASSRFPKSVWRHYEELRRVPAGLLIIGDAICAFNPVYAQGMTVSAIEAVALDQSLHETRESPGLLSSLWRRYFRKTAKVLRTAWLLAATEDFAFPGTHGERPPAIAVWGRMNLEIQRRSAKPPSY